MGLLRRVASKAKHVILNKMHQAERLAPTTPDPDSRTLQQPKCDVLFVNGCDLPTLRRYRVEHQREQLELRGISTSEVHYTAVNPSDADRAHTLVIYRCPHTPAVESLINRAHKQRKLVFFDVDDLVCDVSYTDKLPFVEALSPAEKAIFDDGVTRNGLTLALCDAAIVTTECLAKELSSVCPHVYINRNAASIEMVHLSEKARKEHPHSVVKRTEVVMGYFSGSLTHNADFLEIVSALAHVMEARPNVQLEVVGEVDLPEELDHLKDRIIHAPFVDWQELPSLIASVDINLAPLERTLFNEAKSENKWTEAALVGVPTVATNFGAFAQVVRDGETGFLCTDSASWENTLLSLVDSQELRKRIGEQARLWCLAHATTITTGTTLVQLLAPSDSSIESLCPRDPKLQESYVDAYLTTRGLNHSELIYKANPWEAFSIEDRLATAKVSIERGRRLALFAYERLCGDDATFRYFGYNCAQRLASSKTWSGTWLFVDELARNDVRELVTHASGIVLVRCRVRPELIDLSHFAHEAGIPMAYCLDDNALGAKTAPRIIRDMASDQASEFERDFWCGVTERFRLASELTSCFIVPLSNYGEMLARETGKPAFVVHSSLNDEQIEVASTIALSRSNNRTDRRFIIGYFSGTYSHQADFRLARDGLIELLRRHPNTCLLLGGRIKLDNELMRLVEEGRIIVMPPVDYVTLQYLQASCDAVVAPLVIDDFTNCKSALKVFEAGIVGVPACTSDSFAYREAIEDGITGIVVAEGRSWDEQLENLYQELSAHADKWSHAAFERASHFYYGDAILAELETSLDALAELDPAVNIFQSEQAVATRDIDDWDNPFVANPLFAR